MISEYGVISSPPPPTPSPYRTLVVPLSRRDGQITRRLEDIARQLSRLAAENADAPEPAAGLGSVQTTGISSMCPW